MRQEIIDAATKFSSVKTMGETIDLLALAETKQEADALKDAYVQALIRDGQSPQVASNIVASNIGYMTGYFGQREAALLLDVYGVSHPVFGRSHADGTLTPEGALNLGKEMDRRREKE